MQQRSYNHTRSGRLRVGKKRAANLLTGDKRKGDDHVLQTKPGETN